MDASSLLSLPSSPAPSSLQIFALFINFFFPVLAFIVVSVRVAGRVASSQFAIDDWLVCIAMLMSGAETVISFFFIKTNFIGIPISQVPPHDPTQGLIWAYAVQILYNPILALVKSSALIFLSRLFGQKDGVRRFLLWLNIANISQMVAVFFAITFQCLPIAFNWDPTIRNGRCVDRRILYTCTAVINIITDLLILGTPIWIFAKLKIPRRTKIALLFVFLLGFLVTITSIVRLVLLVQGLFNLTALSDPTSNIGFVTSAIETNLALITASAPALRPIFRRRERGGWFGRSSVAPTRNGSRPPDLESGQKSVGWDGANRSSSPARSIRAKFGRGGSKVGRGGRTKTSSRRGGRGGKLRPIITRVITTEQPQELRSSSPRGSEEQTMTNNGIMRVSDIQREINEIAKDIDIGLARTTMRDSEGTISIGLANDGEEPPRGRTRERYYSESIYPEYVPDLPGSSDSKHLDLRVRDEERRYNEDRVSRRYGVVTPKTSRGWEESGRPF
ncbi:hypothetical protein QBC40DRAFT_239112 [Triangularia verruculosa]|uniref:Rhodopsin domain-containing protein n=1 Tax=Triangularia verruculosa TaxID=2587418 RepID=A0AAN6X6X8_9PEZI|nr:hypothetical protein QBC40DRAFT_239112 [Triangularia verruculosa]